MLRDLSTTDFPEWLSPMVVKEFRQGLRTRSFVASFIVTQSVLAVAGLVSLLTAQLDPVGGLSISFVMWLLIALLLFVVAPLRAGLSLRNETKNKTLELLLMSNLNAKRIVKGKWLAACGQTLLLITSMLPYLLLRYFFGGLEIVAEMIALALMLLASGCATAFALLLATLTPMARIALSIIGVPGMLLLTCCLGSATGSSGLGLAFVALFLGSMFTFVGLENAASNLVSPHTHGLEALEQAASRLVIPSDH